MDRSFVVAGGNCRSGFTPTGAAAAGRTAFVKETVQISRLARPTEPSEPDHRDRIRRRVVGGLDAAEAHRGAANDASVSRAPRRPPPSHRAPQSCPVAPQSPGRGPARPVY